MIAFIIWFTVLCLASVGLGKLYSYMIQPGQILAFMQPVIAEMKHHNQFIYKSIGGCDVCTRQRFTDMSYIFLIMIMPPILPDTNQVLLAIIYIFLYCLYGGLAFYFEAFVTQEPQQHPVIKSSKIEL